MAAVCGKLWADYIQALLDALSIMGNPIIESARILIDSRVGNGIGGVYGGTWMHPRLAIDFARWLNPKFAVWMDGWFLESVSSSPPAQEQPHGGAI